MSHYKFDPFSRRAFIRGVGGWIAVPLLSSLIPESAMAATVNRKRFIAITTPNQFPSHSFFPTNFQQKVIPTDLASAINIVNESPYGHRSLSLSSVVGLRGQISPFFDPSLNPIVSKLALYRGLDMPGRVDHGRGTSLGNMAASHLGTGRQYKPMRTTDEFLASSTNFYTGGKLGFRFPIMRLGETSISTTTISETDVTQGSGLGGANGGLTLNGNLTQIFNSMFEVRASAANKIPVVDRLKAGVAAIKSTRKISKANSIQLDNYMDSLSQIGASLSSPSSTPTIVKPNLTFPNYNGPGIGYAAQAVGMTNDYYSNLAKLIVLGIQCNSSKIFTVGVDSALSAANYCMSQSGSVTEWHLTAHANDMAKLFSLQKFIFDKVFIEIMKGLDVPEADGQTYLDNTIMMMTGECSNGHSGINFGGVLAGGAACGIGLSNAYDFSNWSAGESVTSGDAKIAPGQPINRLWVGILKSLGLSSTDYLNRFGNGSNTFGIWTPQYGDNYESEFGTLAREKYLSKPLPGLFSVT